MGMEPGFGYLYPAGTPGPSTEFGFARCSECGLMREVELTTDLGQTFAEPEDSPCCGAEWDLDDFDPYTREDYEADQADRELDR